MITATEIQMRMNAAKMKTNSLAKLVDSMVLDELKGLAYLVSGRGEVCAKRARYIRKRGDQVWYAGRTKNGKARYRWLPCVNIVYKDAVIFGTGTVKNGKRIDPKSMYKDK